MASSILGASGGCSIRRILVMIITISIIFMHIPAVISYNSQEGPKITLCRGRSKILYVGGNGSGNYSKIQDAINDAIDGDTIRVFAGTYYESIKINKSVTLIGNGSLNTILDSHSKWDAEDVINITADRVNISGFTVMNSEINYGKAGIKLYNSNQCKIEFNNCSRLEYGIFLDNSHYNTIMHNECLNNYYGTLIYRSMNNSFVNNKCTGNSYSISLIKKPSQNVFESNNFSYDQWGSELNDVSYNSFIDNIFIGNYRFGGISLYYTSNITFINNLFSVHEYGIWIFGDNVHHYNTHIIENNTINGKPIHFWKNVNGGNIPLNGSQLILANCKNIVIENQESVMKIVVLKWRFQITI